ncbi:MAG: glycerate kinase [Peptostreptococcaceae bacterium]|nr:glycerate kinase [Peptostreptococcaceae bacterium]
MKKIVLIPDSFKGTLSSEKICSIMEQQIHSIYEDCEVISIPVADGGEGSVDSFISAVGGIKIEERVKNPYFEDMTSYYGLIDEGHTAIVEMASCAGLPLVVDRKNPELTTTYGVGQLIMAAARKGVDKIIVGLGGSSTNDGGCGAAAAIGIRFFDASNHSFIPTGGTLQNIKTIDCSNKSHLLDSLEIVTMCDIDNPMYGPTGASTIFGPQKGATTEMVKALDEGVKNLSVVIEKTCGKDLSQVPGTGAAGAMGASMLAFFGSELKMGIEIVLDTVNFDEVIQDADVIFTGEGKLDSQSLRGKVIFGVAHRAKKYHKPVIAVVGGVDDEIEADICVSGVSAIFPINRLPKDFSVSRKNSEENLAHTMKNIVNLINLGL